MDNVEKLELAIKHINDEHPFVGDLNEAENLIREVMLDLEVTARLATK
jgi:hypothetical protein